MPQEDKSTARSSNDVDNIRKILFGDQIAQVEDRFNTVENSISQLRTENRNLRQALEAEVTRREEAFQELTNMVDAALKERDDSRYANFSAQNKLLDALKAALQAYQAGVVPPSGSKK